MNWSDNQPLNLSDKNKRWFSILAKKSQKWIPGAVTEAAASQQTNPVWLSSPPDQLLHPLTPGHIFQDSFHIDSHHWSQFYKAISTYKISGKLIKLPKANSSLTTFCDDSKCWIDGNNAWNCSCPPHSSNNQRKEAEIALTVGSRSNWSLLRHQGTFRVKVCPLALSRV